jgi:hypothetical protein
MTNRLYLRLCLAFATTSTLGLMGCPSEDVVVVDDHSEVQVTSITEDTLTLDVNSGGSQPFEVGDILVGSDEGGYLRRVLSVSNSGGQVQADTEQVALSEAVELGVLDGEVQWTTQDYQRAGARLANKGGTAIDFGGTEIFHENGLKVTITNGIIDFAPKMKLEAGWKDHRLENLTSYTGGDLRIEFDIRVETTGPVVFSDEWILWEVSQPFTFAIGPIPVVGTARLAFPLGIIANVNGASFIETGFDTSQRCVFGASYQRGSGWTDLTEVGEVATNGHEPVWQINAGLGVEVYMKVEGGLNLYQVSDLTAAAIPYLAADAWLVPAPQTLVLAAGLDGEIGYELGIFDINLVDENWYFTGPRWTLYQGSWNNPSEELPTTPVTDVTEVAAVR